MIARQKRKPRSRLLRLILRLRKRLRKTLQRLRKQLPRLQPRRRAVVTSKAGSGEDSPGLPTSEPMHPLPPDSPWCKSRRCPVRRMRMCWSPHCANGVMGVVRSEPRITCYMFRWDRLPIERRLRSQAEAAV